MTNVITVASRRTIDVDVFLNGQEDIIGYQLGSDAIKEFTVKPPFPEVPPLGTKTIISIKVYGRIEYTLNSSTKATELISYEAFEGLLKMEVETKLKEAKDKGICVSYVAIAPTEDKECNNCSYKTICP